VHGWLPLHGSVVLGSDARHTWILSQLLNLVIIVILILVVSILLQVLFGRIVAQQFGSTILLLVFQSRVVLIEHLALLREPPWHGLFEWWRHLRLRWLVVQICLSHIFELIFSILISVILMGLRWGTFAFHLLLELVTAHTDLAVLTLS
jgi:hypothetical protein